MSLCLSFSLPLLSQTKAKGATAPEASKEKALSERPITDEVFYFMMNDRFADGDPANNRGGEAAPQGKDSREDIARHGFEPTHDSFYHGGDFAGISQKLDYLQGLGITALWLSPILKNKATQVGDSPYGVIAGYHGYWTLDFTQVDPHLGTDADFKRLVAGAHARGMKVFIDVITNHTADLISYRECQDCPYRSRAEFPYAGKRLGKDLNPGFVDGVGSEANFKRLVDPSYAYTPFLPQNELRKKPEWLNDLIYYHNRGNSTFSGENSELGDFFGLDDLFTEHPRVLAGMIDIYADLIKRYKFDGFRIDTVKHVNIDFWQKFVPAMHEAARSVGIPWFFIFGEVFSADPAVLSQYTRNGKFDSVLDFAFQSAVKDVFAEGQSPDRIQDLLSQDDLHRIASSPQKMLTFISNHDIGRLAYFMKNKYKDASDAELLQRMIQAHAFLFLARGIPVVYYGDEQGFVGFGGDKGAREDMFATQTPSYKALPRIGSNRPLGSDSFDTTHPLYRAISELTRVYRERPALRTGEYQAVRTLGPKILAFKRSLHQEAEDELVVFNLDPKAEAALAIKATRVIYGDVKTLQKGASYELPPLAYAILSVPKEKSSARQTPAFTNLREQQRVGQLFYAELNAPEGSDVAFSIKSAHDKSFKPLYRDLNAPYRAYVSGFPDGTPLEIKASIKAPGAPLQSASISVLIDSRPPSVTLSYAEASRRDGAYIVGHDGRIAVETKVTADAAYQFQWPLDEEGQSIFYLRREKDHAIFDRPILLSYREHILPALKTGQEPRVTLRIDASQKVTSAVLPAATAAGAAPQTLALVSDAPFGARKIYVRGGMNSWQSKDEMIFDGRGCYQKEVKLEAGLTEFKFADADWSATSNFGAPVTAEGLSSSGASGNLSVQIPARKAGRYRFELCFARSSETAPPYVFPRIEELGSTAN